MFCRNDSGNAIVLSAALIVALGVGAAAYLYKDQIFPQNKTEQISAQTSNQDTIETAAGQGNAQPQNNGTQVTNANIPQDNLGEFDGTVVEKGNPVVARVNGEDITRTDIYNYITTLPPNIQQLPAEMVWPQAVEQVIGTKVVAIRSKDSGLQNDPEVQELINQAQEQIIRNVYLQREVNKQIKEEDLKTLYDTLIASVPDVEERKARHILVEEEQKAKDLIQQLESGAKIEDLARENSIGPTAVQGGDLGWFTKDTMVPEFSEAVFALSKGEYTKEPVKTQFGWHVIQLEDSRTQAKPKLEEVQQELTAQIQREKTNELVRQWKEDATIEQFDINGDPVEPAAGSEE